jgi:hypothetical protein
MRAITQHQVEGHETSLAINVTDEIGAGNANHRYELSIPNAHTNKSGYGGTTLSILFQNGTIPDNGVNGVTQEALLVIAADRLNSFQNGPFACDDNAEALEHIVSAINCLHRRTKNRIAAGTEGKHVV